MFVIFYNQFIVRHILIKHCQFRNAGLGDINMTTVTEALEQLQIEATVKRSLLYSYTWLKFYIIRQKNCKF